MVGGQREMPDIGRGVEVVGNVEVSLVGDGGGGGGLVGAGPDGRSRTGDWVSRTRVTASSKLVASGCPFVGLILASKLGPMGKMGNPIVVPITFVGVDNS